MSVLSMGCPWPLPTPRCGPLDSSPFADPILAKVPPPTISTPPSKVQGTPPGTPPPPIPPFPLTVSSSAPLPAAVVDLQVPEGFPSMPDHPPPSLPAREVEHEGDDMARREQLLPSPEVTPNPPIASILLPVRHEMTESGESEGEYEYEDVSDSAQGPDTGGPMSGVASFALPVSVAVVPAGNSVAGRCVSANNWVRKQEDRRMMAVIEVLMRVSMKL
jgi:hypothetical protein